MGADVTERQSRVNGKVKGAAAQPGARRGGRPSQRGEILEAAVALFAKGGTRGTTLSAIAERIGVTAPAITHHFGTKEALLREVVANTDRLDAGVLGPPPDATGLERIRTTQTWAKIMVGDPALANLSRLSVVMTAEALDPEYSAHAQFVRRHREFRRAMQNNIELGQKDGTIRTDVDARLVATEVISFMQGAGLQWFLDPEGFDLVGVYDQYFGRLIDELKPRRSGRVSAGTGAKRRGGGRSGARPAPRG